VIEDLNYKISVLQGEISSLKKDLENWQNTKFQLENELSRAKNDQNRLES
jgi:regulator of replication initiation timing